MGHKRIERMVALPLLAIDPGTSTGWALAVGGALQSWGTVPGVAWGDPQAVQRLRAAMPPARIAVVEMPRVYPHVAKWKGDPQILVRLGLLAGRIGESFELAAYVEPKTWQRGSPPERVLWSDTRRRMFPAELAAVESSKLSPHARDAVGILLYSLHRPIQSV